MAIIRPSTRRIQNGDYAIAVVGNTAYLGKIRTNYRSSMTITGYAAEISESLKEFLIEGKTQDDFLSRERGEGTDLLICTLLKNCRKGQARITEADVANTVNQEQYVSILRHLQHYPDRHYYLS